VVLPIDEFAIFRSMTNHSDLPFSADAEKSIFGGGFRRSISAYYKIPFPFIEIAMTVLLPLFIVNPTFYFQEWITFKDTEIWQFLYFQFRENRRINAT